MFSLDRFQPRQRVDSTQQNAPQLKLPLPVHGCNILFSSAAHWPFLSSFPVDRGAARRLSGFHAYDGGFEGFPPRAAAGCTTKTCRLTLSRLLGILQDYSEH